MSFVSTMAATWPWTLLWTEPLHQPLGLFRNRSLSRWSTLRLPATRLLAQGSRSRGHGHPAIHHLCQGTYQLYLPTSLKGHPVFYCSLLKRYVMLLLSSPTSRTPAPHFVEGGVVYTTCTILDSRPSSWPLTCGLTKLQAKGVLLCAVPPRSGISAHQRFSPSGAHVVRSSVTDEDFHTRLNKSSVINFSPISNKRLSHRLLPAWSSSSVPACLVLINHRWF